MAKAIEQGMPKLRIEEAAARTPGPHRLRPQSGRRRQQVPARPETLDVLEVDNATCYAQQIAKLERLRAERDDDDDAPLLDALTAGASAGDGNLLALAVDAARAKATVGEISDALEKVFGRHQAEIRTISGVYRDEAGGDDDRRRVLGRPTSSRRPRAGAPHPGRQDGPGRPRPRPEGRSPPPSPTSASTSTSARCSRRRRGRPAGGRRRRARRRRLSLAAGHLTLVPALKTALAELGRPTSWSSSAASSRPTTSPR
jgi:methylmalonyl-CoA mutase